jgi:hypothetical protein
MIEVLTYGLDEVENGQGVEGDKIVDVLGALSLMSLCFLGLTLDAAGAINLPSRCIRIERNFHCP